MSLTVLRKQVRKRASNFIGDVVRHITTVEILE